MFGQYTGFTNGNTKSIAHTNLQNNKTVVWNGILAKDESFRFCALIDKIAFDCLYEVYARMVAKHKVNKLEIFQKVFLSMQTWNQNFWDQEYSIIVSEYPDIEEQFILCFLEHVKHNHKNLMGGTKKQIRVKRPPFIQFYIFFISDIVASPEVQTLKYFKQGQIDRYVLIMSCILNALNRCSRGCITFVESVANTKQQKPTHSNQKSNKVTKINSAAQMNQNTKNVVRVDYNNHHEIEESDVESDGSEDEDSDIDDSLSHRNQWVEKDFEKLVPKENIRKESAFQPPPIQSSITGQQKQSQSKQSQQLKQNSTPIQNSIPTGEKFIHTALENSTQPQNSMTTATTENEDSHLLNKKVLVKTQPTLHVIHSQSAKPKIETSPLNEVNLSTEANLQIGVDQIETKPQIETKQIEAPKTLIVEDLVTPLKPIPEIQEIEIVKESSVTNTPIKENEAPKNTNEENKVSVGALVTKRVINRNSSGEKLSSRGSGTKNSKQVFVRSQPLKSSKDENKNENLQKDNVSQSQEVEDESSREDVEDEQSFSTKNESQDEQSQDEDEQSQDEDETDGESLGDVDTETDDSCENESENGDESEIENSEANDGSEEMSDEDSVSTAITSSTTNSAENY